MVQQAPAPMTRLVPGESFVRLTTDDTELLLPALVQYGASFHLAGQKRLDVRGMDVAEVALLAAVYNARVSDLETVVSSPGDGFGPTMQRSASSGTPQGTAIPPA